MITHHKIVPTSQQPLIQVKPVFHKLPPNHLIKSPNHIINLSKHPLTQNPTRFPMVHVHPVSKAPNLFYSKFVLFGLWLKSSYNIL